MKKLMMRFAVLCAALITLCVFAAAETVIETTSLSDSVTLTVEGDEKVLVNATGLQTGMQYLIIAQNAEGAPNENNIVYGTAAAFTVFPNTLETGTTYYVYLSSNASSGSVTGFTQVGTFRSVEQQTEPERKPGDVDNDRLYTAGDVLYIIQMSVGLPNGDVAWTADERAAADYDSDGEFTATDANQVIQLMK